MNEVNGKIQYRDKEYRIAFNLNVMEEIQEEYGTLEKWGDLTEGAEGEPDAKAVKFGFCAMLNEGIDIDNEKNGTDVKPLTLKQVGRIITEVGIGLIADKLQELVIESTKSAEKNV